jgi:transposase
MSHISARLTEAQVVTILTQYTTKKTSTKDAQAKLGLKRSRFFDLVKEFKKSASSFAIARAADKRKPRISADTESHIKEALEEEKRLIEDKTVPIRWYNYSAVRDLLKEKHNIEVSVPTIINRAKSLGCFIPRTERAKHERIVSTDFVGELVQHDSSHHRFSPFMDDKLYLITSLDDHSRLMLFADLFEEETTWHHIEALRHVFTMYGVPLKYYADQHSIFRYVKDRDAKRPHTDYVKFTDDVDPQWKAALKRCGSDVIYALSPQAKGKIERPYRWLQDRLVRTAAKEKLTTTDDLKEVLRNLVDMYNTRWIHSTTKEIPIVRFENALNGNCSLFKPLSLAAPHKEVNDLCCLSFTRTTDGYRSLSFDGILFRLPNARSYTETEIHLALEAESGLVVVRFWQQGRFVEEHRVKPSQLKTVRF